MVVGIEVAKLPYTARWDAVTLSHGTSRLRDVLTVKSKTRILHVKLLNPSGRLRPLVILCCARESHCASPFSQKRLSPSGPKRELALIPMGSLKEKVVPTGA